MQPLDRANIPVSDEVQKAIAKLVPSVTLVAANMESNAKGRRRESRMPGSAREPLLRTEAWPRGLPHLTGRFASQVQADNENSDFLLAIQFVMNLHSRGALRENPRQSLHWCDPCEVFLASSGEWDDLDYDSCVFMSARRKQERFCHNLDELNKLPALVCAHQHEAGEWKLRHFLDGEAISPSCEETEHTAHLVFTIAAAASYWAARRGWATMKISRLPPI